MTQYDPEVAVGLIIEFLERWGWRAIPHGAIPPADRDALAAARTAAERSAVAAGRADDLRHLRMTIAEWAMGQYRRAGFESAYLGGWLEDPAARREATDVLVDAATANLLLDIIPDDVAVTLLTRMDIWLGGPLFRIEAGPGSTGERPT